MAQVRIERIGRMWWGGRGGGWIAEICHHYREIKDDGMNGDTSKHHYQTPMLDENAPDLYIPLMAFITYILVTGYAKGTKNSFTPEVLVEVSVISKRVGLARGVGCSLYLVYTYLPTMLGYYLMSGDANLGNCLDSLWSLSPCCSRQPHGLVGSDWIQICRPQHQYDSGSIFWTMVLLDSLGLHRNSSRLFQSENLCTGSPIGRTKRSIVSTCTSGVDGTRIFSLAILLRMVAGV